MSAAAERPVFVIGPARSGTTLVYKALCLHPRAAWFSQYSRRLPSLAPVAVLNRFAASRPALRDRAWFGRDRSNAYVYGRRRRLAERAWPMPVEAEPVYRSCGIPEGELDRAADDQRAALRRRFEGLRRWSGGDVVVAKRVANNRRIGLLADVFPDARFVVVLRDGRDVAASLSRVDWWSDCHLWWYGGTPRDWESEGGDPWECCARHWVAEVEAVERGLATVDAARVRRVRYEEVVEDPSGALGPVASFAGLEVTAEYAAALASLSAPWRVPTPTLGVTALATVERLQGDALVRLGYA